MIDIYLPHFFLIIVKKWFKENLETTVDGRVYCLGYDWLIWWYIFHFLYLIASKIICLICSFGIKENWCGGKGIEIIRYWWDKAIIAADQPCTKTCEATAFMFSSSHFEPLHYYVCSVPSKHSCTRMWPWACPCTITFGQMYRILSILNRLSGVLEIQTWS